MYLFVTNQKCVSFDLKNLNLNSKSFLLVKFMLAFIFCSNSKLESKFLKWIKSITFLITMVIGHFYTWAEEYHNNFLLKLLNVLRMKHFITLLRRLFRKQKQYLMYNSKITMRMYLKCTFHTYWLQLVYELHRTIFLSTVLRSFLKYREWEVSKER